MREFYRSCNKNIRQPKRQIDFFERVQAINSNQKKSCPNINPVFRFNHLSANRSMQGFGLEKQGSKSKVLNSLLQIQLLNY